MKRFLIVPGLVVTFAGCLILLPMLAWASIHDPQLSWIDYSIEVASRLSVGRAGWITLGGAAAVVIGLAMTLYSALLAETEGHERLEALPVYWAVLTCGVLTTFALLGGVNYLALEAGTVPAIWRSVNL